MKQSVDYWLIFQIIKQIILTQQGLKGGTG